MASVNTKIVMAPIAFTLSQASKVMNLSENTMRVLIKRGYLPVAPIGSRRLIRRKALEQMLERAEQYGGLSTKPLSAKEKEESVLAQL